MSPVYEAKPAPDSAERNVAKLAAAQHGVFTRSQASECGVPRGTIDRRIANGVWDRIYAGVYRLAGAPPTWRQALVTACLIWGPGAVISHRAAAALWRLAGFVAQTIELSLPRRRERLHPATVHVPRSLPAVDVTSIDRIPVTTPARTLIDLASCVEAEVVEEALDDALRRNLVTIPRLRWRLQEIGSHGRRGSGVIAHLIEARASTSAVPQSVFETRLLRVLRRGGLPLPELQYRVRTDRGEAILDFAYVDEKIAIEADGFQWHSSRQQLDHDRERGNALAMLGWIVIRVTWTQLRDRPGEMVGAIRSILATRRTPG